MSLEVQDLDSELWVQDSEALAKDSKVEYEIQKPKLHILKLEIQVPDARFRIQSHEFKIQKLRNGILKPEFRIQKTQSSDSRILRAYWKNRLLISARLTTAQRNIIVTIAIYTLSYLGLLGFPSIAAGLIMLIGAPITSFPIGALYFISSSLVASCFCFINLLTVTPYRRALKSLFRRLLPNLIGSSNSSATVSGNQVAVAGFPVSLFTGERERIRLAQNHNS